MRELLPLLTKPSHYAGNEIGAVIKDPAGIRARMALAFPDLYEVGMSYTGLSILYDAVNRRADFWAERVFAPTLDAAETLKQNQARLCTLESDAPLDQMDIVGFSLTHELAFTNVLYMLDLAGLKLRAEQRKETFPLVLVGGGCAFNAEPLAPFVDLMLIGDGEEGLPEILERTARAKEKGLSKAETLYELKEVPGVYVPSFFETPPSGPALPLVPRYEDYPEVEKRIVEDINAVPFPTSQPQPFDAVHDRYTLEIARGCTRGCRFCHAGMVYRPVRERSLENLDQTLEQGLTETGYGEVSFLALSAGDFSGLAGLFSQSLERCRREQVSISLPSLRVGSVNEEIIKSIAGIRRTGATLAPEAGSQRLRDVINKGVGEEELLTHAATLFKHGWKSIKLYFMIGLPTETEEDLAAILDLCLKVERAAVSLPGKGGHRLQVTAAISPFVPKPHTPFQWCEQIGLEETRRRIDFLKNIFRPHKRLKLKWHLPEMSFLEGILSRADRRLAPVLEKAYAKGGVFCSWNDRLSLPPWLEAMEECGLAPADYLAERDLDDPLPWDHLNCGVKKSFLRQELNRALRERLTPDCRFGPCRGCGVCNYEGRRSGLARQSAEKLIRPVLNRASRDQTPNGQIQEDQEAEPPSDNRERLGEKAVHYRFWYEKLDEAVYLSQLELQSIFERTFRRAGAPIAFSQGFHPLPLFSFARALPVGVSSLAEYFDLFFRENISPSELFKAVAPKLPKGLNLTRLETLSLSKKQPQAAAEEYILCFIGPEELQPGFDESWAGFRKSASLVWNRMTRKGARSYDIRPMFAEIDIQSPGRVRFRLDWSERYLNPLAMVLAVLDSDLPSHLRLTKTGQFFPGPDKPTS